MSTKLETCLKARLTAPIRSTMHYLRRPYAQAKLRRGEKRRRPVALVYFRGYGRAENGAWLRTVLYSTSRLTNRWPVAISGCAEMTAAVITIRRHCGVRLIFG